MIEKDIKGSIKVSDKLDSYILKGIEQGRCQKRFSKKRSTVKMIAKASSLVIVGTLGLGIVNPDIVRAIPIIGKVLEGFDSSNFGEPTNKYLQYSQGVDFVSENKEARVTLNDVIIDENIVMLGVVIESEALAGFDGKNQGDFVNIDAEIFLDGKRADNIGCKGRKIDETTGAVVITSNIAELKLDDSVKVKLNIDHISGEKQVSGNWDFKFTAKKVEGSKRLSINNKYKIKDRELVVEEVVISPLESTLLLSGIDDTTNYTLQSTKYRVIDDKGNILKSSMGSSSVDNKTGEYNDKLMIKEDLSNTKYIELVPYWGFDTIDESIEGINHELLITSGSGEREKTIISREPSKEELKNGYALSKVYYNLNLDKNKEFLSLEQLKNYEIEVNDKEKVIIQDIKVTNNKTKITMKIDGNYDYNYLSQLVIFDETMNDTTRWEGHIGAVLENEQEGIYSITLDKIDSSKKYKIAVPMTKNINLTNEYKARINLH